MSIGIVGAAYVAAAVLFILSLGGLSGQESAKRAVWYGVAGMTCGHCVNAITQALKAVDSTAEVRIDLAQHRVEIESSVAGAASLGDAIRDAGYTPVAV